MRAVLTVGLVAGVAVAEAMAWSFGGTVVDSTGRALSGVRVEHLCSSVVDSTDGSGAFYLSDGSGVAVGGAVRVEQGVQGDVEARFDLVGRRLAAEHLHASGLAIGGMRGVASGVYVGPSRQGARAVNGGLVRSLGKQVACLTDTLQFSKSDYVVRRIVPATSTGVRVVLKQAGVINVTVQQAKALIDNNAGNSDFVIIDIRTASEFAARHIAGATNIDFYSPTFQAQVANLDRSKTYLVHCLSGTRSGNAMPVFTSLGFETVHNMQGGINAWVAAGYPVVP